MLKVDFEFALELSDRLAKAIARHTDEVVRAKLDQDDHDAAFHVGMVQGLLNFAAWLEMVDEDTAQRILYEMRDEVEGQVLEATLAECECELDEVCGESPQTEGVVA